jgi:hypothetical protein
MLKVTRGVGVSVNDVKDDIVMARGPSPGWLDVQTTTLWGRRRIMERSCSGRGTRLVGWTVGVSTGTVCDCFEAEDVWFLLSGYISLARIRHVG